MSNISGKTTTLAGEFRVQESCIDCGANYLEPSKDGQLDREGWSRRKFLHLEALFPNLPHLLPDGTVIKVTVTVP